jgi:hypothetical protein
VTRVVLALERCAETDPPRHVSKRRRVWRLTDEGWAEFWSGEDGAWWFGTDGDVLDPQPSVWYDLRPREGEPLTVEDVLAVLSDARYGVDSPEATRLRAALDALT